MAAKSPQPDKPLVLVVWDDAHSPPATKVVDEWSLDDHHDALPVHTVGWMLRDNEKGVSIGSEWCGDSDFRSTTFVPRALIISITQLRRGKALLPPPPKPLTPTPQV